MKTLRPTILALSLCVSGAAFAQNTTTSGDLLIAPQVTAPGSILNQPPPQTERDVVNDNAADRPIPAGLAPDASAPRQNAVNDLYIGSPVEPLGQTRPDYQELNQPVPLGAEDNSYRPSSSAGYYDTNDGDRRPNVTPSIVPDPAPVAPPRNTAPVGNNIYNRPN